MIRSEALSMARLAVPEAPSGVITDANAYIFLNNAAQEFVKHTFCLPTHTDFTCTAEDGEYAFSVDVPTYLGMRDVGVWWYNTVTSKWVQLDATTSAYMWKNYPTWINDSSGTPARYWPEGDILHIHPKPDTTLADSGFRIYHFAKATDTSAAGHYYFSGSTAQYPWLAPYEVNLLEYYKWKVNEIIGYGAKAEAARTMFYAVAEKAKQEFVYRPDLKKHMRMRGAGNMPHFNRHYKA